MKSSLKKLIFFLFLTAIFSESHGDFFSLLPVAYSMECSHSDRGLMDKADSPFCFDNEAKDFLNWKPQSAPLSKNIAKDHLFSKETFQLSTYSLFVWQPPKIS